MPELNYMSCSSLSDELINQLVYSVWHAPKNLKPKCTTSNTKLESSPRGTPINLEIQIQLHDNWGAREHLFHFNNIRITDTHPLRIHLQVTQPDLGTSSNNQAASFLLRSILILTTSVPTVRITLQVILQESLNDIQSNSISSESNLFWPKLYWHWYQQNPSTSHLCPILFKQHRTPMGRKELETNTRRNTQSSNTHPIMQRSLQSVDPKSIPIQHTSKITHLPINCPLLQSLCLTQRNLLRIT